MQCLKCGKVNIGLSKKCSKCGFELKNQTINREYCPKCGKPLLFPDKPCPYCSDNSKKESVCFECGTPLKKGLIFPSVFKLDQLEMLILKIKENRPLCEKCYKEHKKEFQTKTSKFIDYFMKILEEMPILTIQSPVNLSVSKYCRIVTSQSIVKTGDISEFIENKNVITGVGSFDKEISGSEKSCIFSLKKKALELGANVIIGCDIEYAQLNAPTQIFLIAMMGTAAVVEEFKVLNEYEQKIFNMLFEKELI